MREVPLVVFYSPLVLHTYNQRVSPPLAQAIRYGRTPPAERWPRACIGWWCGMGAEGGKGCEAGGRSSTPPLMRPQLLPLHVLLVPHLVAPPHGGPLCGRLVHAQHVAGVLEPDGWSQLLPHAPLPRRLARQGPTPTLRTEGRPHDAPPRDRGAFLSHSNTPFPHMWRPHFSHMSDIQFFPNSFSPTSQECHPF